MHLRRIARLLFPALAGLLQLDSAAGQDGAWRIRAKMPTARHDLAVAGVGRLLYAAGGKTGNTCTGLRALESYDPSSDRWSSACAPMPTGRFDPAAVSFRGVLCVLGGDVGCGQRSSANEAYEPGSDAWTSRAPMPTPRTSLAVAAIGERLYAVGGVDDHDVCAANEAYDPVSDTWTSLAPMPTPLASMAAASVAGRLFVVGGCGSAGPVDTVQAYDPHTDTWSTGYARMPTRRSAFAGVALDGLIFVVGGFDPSTSRPVDTVDAYDPASDTWRSGLAPMPTARAYLAAGVVDGRLCAVGGGPDGGVLPAHETFEPSTLLGIACDPGERGVIACPCSNPPSELGRGCDNSAATGGAVLSAVGVARLSTDSVVFTARGEEETAASFVLQGSAAARGGLVHGQGVRCLDGTLVRLYTKTAAGGCIRAPDFAAGDPSISARSAAMGDAILPGQSRWYLVCYRDRTALGACPGSRAYNATQTGEIHWDP